MKKIFFFFCIMSACVTHGMDDSFLGQMQKTHITKPAKKSAVPPKPKADPEVVAAIDRFFAISISSGKDFETLRITGSSDSVEQISKYKSTVPMSVAFLTALFVQQKKSAIRQQPFNVVVPDFLGGECVFTKTKEEISTTAKYIGGRRQGSKDIKYTVEVSQELLERSVLERSTAQNPIEIFATDFDECNNRHEHIVKCTMHEEYIV